jgi:hypothetical protein
LRVRESKLRVREKQIAVFQRLRAVKGLFSTFFRGRFARASALSPSRRADGGQYLGAFGLEPTQKPRGAVEILRRGRDPLLAVLTENPVHLVLRRGAGGKVFRHLALGGVKVALQS